MDWHGLGLGHQTQQRSAQGDHCGPVRLLGLGRGHGFADSAPCHRAVLRVLRPAESAMRRLIVIAARGLVVKVVPSRPMPKGHHRKGRREPDSLLPALR